ncbi:Origin of replication complex subunit 6 [Coemansia thaxteri]|uniref:Origin of replication complex subunit 6 n=1 Tax=Coemansia thaxteri TaxID=2663907 RepID=A0A9W8BFD0_9FUNG|nr:Origin of replication complex subunit 6 [Coemansia thaxteri]KAJ2481045.1 Origin of replication complex subunit 6 [Coemansia sp. RSA 2320]
MAHLNSLLHQLQLEGIPNLAAKAAQYFDQINQRFSGSKVHSLNLAKQPVAIQLACESLSVEFNEAAGSALSALSLREYKKCTQDIRIALGLNKHITLDELDVRFGPPQGIVEYSRRLLAEFKESFGATMPASVSRHMNWDDSAYVVGAFALVCKHFKKRVASKADILALASIKPKVYANALAKLDEFGKATLAEIDSGGTGLAKTPAKKRARKTMDVDELETAPLLATPTMRGRRVAIQQLAVAPVTPVCEVVDEIGSLMRKRTRTQQQIEPQPTTPQRSSAKRQPPFAAVSKTPPKTANSNTEPKRRGRPLSKTAQAVAAAAAASVKAARRAAKAAAPRPRIGIVSMIQDRDYRDTPLYASYQTWKSAVLVDM